MIIATSLGTLFSGLTVSVVNEGTEVPEQPVYYHYGDQSELLTWIKERGNLGKYPLVWYVLDEFTEKHGYYTNDGARIIIMQLTKGDPLNTWRQTNSYTGIIDPVTRAVKNILTTSMPVTILTNNKPHKFREYDKPKYSVMSSVADLPKNGKAVSSDIVDARVLNFGIRVKANCII